MAGTRALVSLSDDLAAAVEAASSHIVTVSGRRRGGATGVHWRPGIVVTADHVLEWDEGVRIHSGHGDAVEVNVVGRDPTTDLAILSVPDGSLTQPANVQTEPAKVGQLVFAVGRPDSSEVSASFGMIGAVAGAWRTWAGGRIDQMVRPDLTFYPGFSGGALIDATGQVLGINTSGLSRAPALTLPSVTVNRVVEQLLKGGRISRGYLGLRMQSVPLPEELSKRLKLTVPQGLLIVAVEEDGPATAAGLLVGDIVLAIQGKPVNESDSVQAVLDPETVGKPVELHILRGGTEARVSVKVAERAGPARHREHGHGRHRGHHTSHA